MEDWQSADFSDQNIYEMSVDNGGPGFWIRRTTWAATCARVVGIGKFTKLGPYFGNPPVVMDVYSLVGELKEGLALVSVPGTYKTWRRVEPPDWEAIIQLRALSDSAIEAAVQAFDRRLPIALDGNPISDRVFLTVPFALKEEAKRLGARWSAVDKRWWISSTNDLAVFEARKLGFL